MTVMNIKIDENKKKALKFLASSEGKSMGNVLVELIDQYLEKNKATLLSEETHDLMQLSETTFKEWDNQEDEIYNEL